MKVLTIFVLFFCIATDVLAQDYATIVQRAFEPVELMSEENWAFTEAYTSEGATRVSRFDPRRPNGQLWTLISIDGQPPTAKDAEEYKRNMRESDDPEGAGEEFGFEFVAPGSLKLIEETATKYRFGFSPVIANDRKNAEMLRHVTGILSIDKRDHFVESIELNSAKPFKPQTGVKISSLNVSIKFGQATTDGQIARLLMTTRVQGRAYRVFHFDEVEQSVYSHYVRLQ